MRIERRNTTEGQSPYHLIAFRLATSEIRNPDGSIVFRLDGIEAPEAWSQVAIDVLAQKYFRKAGVPARLKTVEEAGVPSWLRRSVPDEAALAELPEDQRYGSEISSKQVFDRLAGCWTYWGWKGGYFSSEEDAQAFFDELRFMLATQMCAPNSPQWFNTGLHWAYGIDGPAQGHYYVDHQTGKLTKSTSAYEHPQPHACFIQGVGDDLVNEGGIMDLWVREARLFKYGSGTGSNFSRLRGDGEKLSGGGRSSGLMSFLKIGDRAAGAIKSGGTTRRAAKMVVVDVDHPDIEAYIDWKVKEEQKVAALVAGSKICRKHLKAVMRACVNCEAEGDACFDPEKNPALKREIKLARRAWCRTTPSSASSSSPGRATRTSSSRSTTPTGIRRPTSPSPARTPTTPSRSPTISCAPSSPTATGTLTRRTDGKIDEDPEGPRSLGKDRLRRLGLRRSGPALQHHDERLAHLPGGRAHPRVEPVLGVHVPRRHGLQPRLRRTCSPSTTARPKRSMWLPTSTPCRLWTVVLEISVPMAQFPSKEIARALLRLPHARPRLRQHRRPA